MTQYRAHTQTVAPTGYPVTIPAIKDDLLIDGTRDDNLIGRLIEQATDEIEAITGMALLTQTWRLVLDSWTTRQDVWWDGVREGSRLELEAPKGGDWIDLPVYPLQSVDTVTVYDEASNSTAVTVGTVFDVDTYRWPGRLALKSGQVWPVALRDTNAVEITYTSGYTSVGSIPSPIKRAIANMVAHLYAHRGDCSPGDAYRASGAESVMRRVMVPRL